MCFFGYKTEMKGYVIVHDREIFVSRKVSFYEHVFPYSKDYNCNHDAENNQLSDSFDYFFELVNSDSVRNNYDHNQDNQSEGNTKIIIRLLRQSRAPSNLKDYHYQLSNHIDIEILNDFDKFIHSISAYLDYNKLTAKYLNFSSNQEPQTYNETFKNPKWCKAM